MNVNEAVANKVIKLAQERSAVEQDKLISIFEQQHAKNASRLNAIQCQVKYNAEGIALVFDRVDAIYQEMMHAKSNAEVMANFQSVIDGFTLLGNIGAQMNNSALNIIGTVGASLTQAVLGYAQLTGCLGLTAVTGLAMITPITAIVGAVFCIVSSITSRQQAKKQARQAKKEAEALHNALRTISEQIVNLHKDLLKGFGIVIENQEKIMSLIQESMVNLNFQLNEILSHEYIIEQKLDTVLADIQKLSLKIDQQRLVKLNEYSCRIILDEKMSNQKVLTKIFEELRYSINDDVRNIDSRKNRGR